jgi:lipopolysaccharide transport system permease protein
VPTAALAPMAVEVTVMSGIAAGTAAYYEVTESDIGIRLGPSLALAAAGIALALGIGWGLGLWLATLNALARDVRLTLRFLLPIWLYATPVIYPVSALPDRWRFLATLNPATAPVEMVKEGVLGAGSVTAGALALSLSVCILLCTSGIWFLTRLSPRLLRGAPVIDDDEDEPV